MPLLSPLRRTWPRHVPWLGVEHTALWFAGHHSIHWATSARAQHKIFERDDSFFVFALSPWNMMCTLHLQSIFSSGWQHLKWSVFAVLDSTAPSTNTFSEWMIKSFNIPCQPNGSEIHLHLTLNAAVLKTFFSCYLKLIWLCLYAMKT